MGGSDQWGNIVTGTELIRRMEGGSAFAITSPLIQKADGSKFGKTESGNVWLDPSKTSPYKFYQYWINASDVDAENYLKVFTLKSKDEVDSILSQHAENPGQRLLQNELAKSITTMVHGEENYRAAKEASMILFKKGDDAVRSLKELAPSLFIEIFEGVPQKNIPKSQLKDGMTIIDALVSCTGFLKSNGEARRALNENSISLNKRKVGLETKLSMNDLIADKYLLLQRGKKNYFVITVN